MIWKILLTILIILLVGAGIGAVYFYLNPRDVTEVQNAYQNLYQSEKTAIDLEFEAMDAVTKQPKPVEELYVTGWIPEWDVSDGLAAIATRQGVFDSISPIWFFMNSDGSLRTTPQTNGVNQMDFFRENEVDLIPSVQEFDATNLSAVLNNPDSLNRLVSEIAAQASANNYAGIDLDIEAVKLQDKHLFFEFLEKLSAEFKEMNKSLVFTALPEWSNFFVFGSFPQTSRVQDYKRIADLVDEFRIMSYEFSGPTSQRIGPVQPLEWQEQVIQYTISQGVPREKIVLGVASYSYDWTVRPMLEKIDLKGTTRTPVLEDLDLGVSLTNKDLDKIKANYEYTEEFNEEWGEMILRYAFQGQDRIVVYPNNQSIQMRKELAAEYGIKGVAYWRVGDESDLEL